MWKGNCESVEDKEVLLDFVSEQVSNFKETKSEGKFFYLPKQVTNTYLHKGFGLLRAFVYIIYLI